MQYPQSQVLRFNWKIVCVFLPFAIGISIYYSIKEGQPKGYDQQVKVKQQNSANIPHFYVSVYEECMNELTLTIDNITESFELPPKYPFAYTKCEKSVQNSYSYDLREQENIFTLYKPQEILAIKTINQYSEYTEVIFQYQFILDYNQNQQYSPVYFLRTKNNQIFAILIYTSSKILTQYGDSLFAVKIYGGRVNIKFFLYNNPEETVKALHRYLGGYKLLPVWMLGFQYYGSWVDRQDLEYLKQQNIPLETLWINEVKSQYLPKDLHLIKYSKPTVEDGLLDKKYLIKTKDGPYKGCVNDTIVNYLDYNVPFAINKETTLNTVQYSGVMLEEFKNYKIEDDNHCFESIPIDRNAYHSSKKAYIIQSKVTEQYFHPLNQFAQQKQYNDYSNQVSLSESYFFGTGQFGGYISKAKSLKIAIEELIYSNFIGIPYFGVYGCDQGTSQLNFCSRWLSIQAWMPIFFGHSSKQINFHNHPDYFNQIYNELQTRQSLIKWMLTQFIKNYDNTLGNLVGTVIQPLWWFNTSDEQAFQYSDREFIFGGDILITPILNDPEDENFSQYDVYFPYGVEWIQLNERVIVEGGSKISFNILSFTATPTFQRAGSIIFKQESTLRIDDLNDIYQLYVMFQQTGFTGSAQGQMITLSNLNHYNILGKCLSGKKNCLMNLQIRYECDDLYSSERYYLSAKGINSDTVFEKIYISGINLYHSKMHPEQRFHFDNPILIDENFVKEIEIKQIYY